MNRYKINILRAALAVGCVLVLCTILARRIQYWMLPQVQLVAPANGMLSSSWRFSGTFGPAGENNRPTAQWKCTADTYSAIENWPELSVQLIWKSGADGQTRRLAASVENVEPLLDRTMVQVTACAQGSADAPVGEAVEISVTGQSGPYFTILPLSCLVYQPDGTVSVICVQSESTLWGVQDTVFLQEVTVLDSNDRQAALREDLSAVQIGGYPSRELRSGESVRVIA